MPPASLNLQPFDLKTTCNTLPLRSGRRVLKNRHEAYPKIEHVNFYYPYVKFSDGMINSVDLLIATVHPSDYVLIHMNIVFSDGPVLSYK